MRVTNAMRAYIRDLVAEKVEKRLAAAVKAKAEYDNALDEAGKAVRDYAESLVPAMTEKVAKYAKARGLTYLDHEYDYAGRKRAEANAAFKVILDSDDYMETASGPVDVPPEVAKLRSEPGRINRAVDRAADAIVFALEVGKARKADLEELIAGTEVKL